jgi:hypothetical protein
MAELNKDQIEDIEVAEETAEDVEGGFRPPSHK